MVVLLKQVGFQKSLECVEGCCAYDVIWKFIPVWVHMACVLWTKSTQCLHRRLWLFFFFLTSQFAGECTKSNSCFFKLGVEQRQTLLEWDLNQQPPGCCSTNSAMLAVSLFC